MESPKKASPFILITWYRDWKESSSRRKVERTILPNGAEMAAISGAPCPVPGNEAPEPPSHGLLSYHLYRFA
jgi:hypothetical protein